MSPARRKTAQQLLGEAVAAAHVELSAAQDEIERIRIATQLIDALGSARRDIAQARISPVVTLHTSGWSFEAIAQACGLSKNAVRQIRLESRGQPRSRPRPTRSSGDADTDSDSDR